MKRGVFASICFCVLSVASSSSGRDLTCKTRPSFSSDGSLGEIVLRELRQSRSTVRLALYGFNNTTIAEELIRLAGRGISVRVKIDAEKSAEKRERQIIEMLRPAGIEVRAVAPDGRNHNKFAILDGATVITGSYNWTLKAERNWENLLILDCPELAKLYLQEWEKIR